MCNPCWRQLRSLPEPTPKLACFCGFLLLQGRAQLEHEQLRVRRHERCCQCGRGSAHRPGRERLSVPAQVGSAPWLTM